MLVHLLVGLLLFPFFSPGFDLGLAFAFPVIVGTCALFILFPLYAPNLAESAGSIPTI